jgi:nucleoside-diphosphate-sugar epimerase
LVPRLVAAGHEVHGHRGRSRRDGGGDLFAGEAGVAMMTEIRGASNDKAKRELGWTPSYPTWRQGFRDGLG